MSSGSKHFSFSSWCFISHLFHIVFSSEICGGRSQQSGLCTVVLHRSTSCFPVICRRVSGLFTGEQSGLGEQRLPWSSLALSFPATIMWFRWVIRERESVAWFMSFPFPPLSLIFKVCCSNPMPSFYRSHNPFRPQKIPSDWDSLDNQLYSLSSFMQYWQQWQLREVTRRLLVL